MASKSNARAVGVVDTGLILFFFLLIFATGEATVQMNAAADASSLTTAMLFQQENQQGVADDAVWLLNFKASITSDPSGLLHSWNSSTHPCDSLTSGSGWYGVSCELLSGRLAVVSLNLTGISLSGALSSSLANLTHLRILSLAHNAFSGHIPPELGYISSLQVLELQGCNFSGSIPSSFADHASLRFLNLSNNFLSGSIPDALIGAAPNLSILDLSNNLLSGNILTIINNSSGGSCQLLTYLSLSNNFLTEEIPLDIGKCSNLTVLLLNGNILQGKIPAEIGQLSQLQILDVSRNSLTDAIPIELASCRSLSVLVLSNLVDFGALDFSSFRGEFNTFDGNLPLEVLFLPNLQMLWAPRSNLGGGPLPTNWTASCSLRVLNLAQNNITGYVPGSLIAMCTNLTYLDLSSNALSGFLPSNLLSLIPCMVYLNVSRNSLYGNVSFPLHHDFDNATACSHRLFSSCCGRDLAGLLDFHGSNTFTDEDGLIKKPSYSFLNPCQGSSVTNEPGLELSSTSDSTLIVAHDLSWNNFTGPLPQFSPLLKAGSSYWLLLNNNNFTAFTSAELVSSFCSNLLHSLYLNVNANRIHGELGSNYGNCSKLVHFEAAQNLIGGSIPAQVRELNMLRYLDLSKNFLSGSIPTSLVELKGLQYILLSENNLTGRIPDQLGQLTSLVVFNLSHNQLIGSIPTSLGEAPGLEILLLDHNSLSGDIPSSLAALSNLTQLDLSFNNLSGQIPQFQHISSCDGFKDNKFLQSCPEQSSNTSLAPARFPSPVQVVDQSHKHSNSKRFLMAISSTVSILFFVVVVLIGLFLGRRKVTRQASIRRKVMVAFADAPAGLNYDNVVRATGNFSIENLIGTGGFGSTYKAELFPGFLVAVKRLSIGRFQGIKQFDAEIRTLGRIRHKNLVTLIGYYVGDAEMFLIYKYLPGGNLETFIHENLGMDKNWQVIHKIAIDIARALTYLHYSCVPRIVHRDIKPSNILLDEQQNAYLSDFGLARLLEVSETHATTDVAGTFGYVAPEYATTCRVSDKADVYSFGVVLLELLSGKKSLDPSFSGYGNAFNIVAWAELLVSEGRSSALFSPELWESGPHDNLLGMLMLASSCTVESLSMRPTMKQVLENLKQLNL